MKAKRVRERGSSQLERNRTNSDGASIAIKLRQSGEQRVRYARVYPVSIGFYFISTFILFIFF